MARRLLRGRRGPPLLSSPYPWPFAFEFPGQTDHVADRVIKLEDGQVVSDVANEVAPAALEAVG